MMRKRIGGSAATFLAMVSMAPNAGAQSPPELDLDYGAGEIETLTFGYLDKGEGPTGIFFHPGVDARYWQLAIEATSQSYRTIALPFDASTPPALATALDLTTIIESVMEGLDVPPPHIVAHSMGGRIALEFAIARPDLIASLTVIEPALAPDDESMQRLRTAAAESTVTCPLPDVPAESQTMCRFNVFINEPGFYDNAPSGLLALVPQPDAPAPPSLEMLWSPVPPICEALGKLEMPILFVRGELTPEPIQASQDAYEACLPDHARAMIPGSSHYPFVYNAEAFNEALLEFLGRH